MVWTVSPAKILQLRQCGHAGMPSLPIRFLHFAEVYSLPNVTEIAVFFLYQLCMSVCFHLRVILVSWEHKYSICEGIQPGVENFKLQVDNLFGNFKAYNQ